MKHTQKILFYVFVFAILILLFVLGRISILWEGQEESCITGVTFASTEEVEDFIEDLKNYSKEDIQINEIDIFEDMKMEESKKDALFVASTRGKYYYPIDSEKGNGLKEESRVYFSSEFEAISNGYIKSD